MSTASRYRRPREQDFSRDATARLLPDASDHLTRVKDDGRAEALLLALHGRAGQIGAVAHLKT